MKHPHFPTSNHIIDSFMQQAQSDVSFTKLLLESFRKAKELAHRELQIDLFEALEWPLSLDTYHHYLITFSLWIPREGKEAIWNIPGTNGHQEVDDRTNHFYWLIDQEVGSDKSTLVENIPWFSEWLIAYSQSWGSFLDTTASFSAETLSTFKENAPLYRVEDSLVKGQSNNPGGWRTFNQFFARSLNPGLRPIVKPFDNKIVSSPADCNFKAIYQIAKDATIPEIVVKNKHKFSSTAELLVGSNYKNAFSNGTFVHYYLSTFSYHRFHAPVSGVVKECYPIHGLVYMDVRIKNHQFDSPDNADDGYEFAQARGVIIIDTKDSPYGDVGIVAVMPIGMSQVSSVNMIATVGSELNKGDEFGYFLFGGSDIIVLFQQGVYPEIDTDPTYRLYGSQIAECKTLS